jgi:hypothetical protein
MARIVRLLGISLLVVFLTAGLATPSANAAPADDEAHFVALINDLRASKGVRPLQVHSHLVSVARNWAATMASAGSIWHNPNLRSDIEAGVPNWQVIGENVGVGPNVPVLHQAFIDSPGHYKNLVDPRFTHIGVGVVFGSDGSMYTAHQFLTLAEVATASAPAPTPPVTAAAPQPVPPQGSEPQAPRPRPAPTAPPTAPTPDEAAPDAAFAGVSQVPAMLAGLRALDAS